MSSEPKLRLQIILQLSQLFNERQKTLLSSPKWFQLVERSAPQCFSNYSEDGIEKYIEMAN